MTKNWEGLRERKEQVDKETLIKVVSRRGELEARVEKEDVRKESEYRPPLQVFFLCKGEGTCIILLDMMMVQGHGLYVWMCIYKGTYHYMCLYIL